MKTTELFVEQMLIGLLVLAAGGLLIPGQPMDAFWNLGPGESAAVLAGRPTRFLLFCATRRLQLAQSW